MNTTSKFISLFIFLISTSIPLHAVVADTNQTENNIQTDETERTNLNDNTQQNIQQEELSPEQQQAIKARKAVDFFRTYLFFWGCLYASFYGKNQSIQQYLRRLAIVEPLARLISTRKFYVKLCNWLPLIGKHMRCTNEQCPGICNHCKLKLIYKEMPLRLGLMLFFNGPRSNIFI